MKEARTITIHNQRAGHDLVIKKEHRASGIEISVLVEGEFAGAADVDIEDLVWALKSLGVIK